MSLFVRVRPASIRIAGLLAVLAWLAGSALAVGQGAAGNLYNVEVIVFRMSGPREGDAADSSRAGSPDAIQGAAQVARYAGPLPPAKLQLSGARQKLVAAGYRVLAHTGWTQTPDSWGTRAGLPVEQVGVRVAGLTGSFQLERGTLLHFGMNLRYATEGAAALQMSEIRRIRLNEKNYYDHPGLGVIAVVTPAGR